MGDVPSLAELVVAEHEFLVPLDHTRPDGQKIKIFAREVAARDGRDRPYLVYFRGGPGFESDRPVQDPRSPSWLDRALHDYRVLFLDYRGTGRSTPVGQLSGMAPEGQADYLAQFRADAIVQDAEVIREALGVEVWSVLGQSFGGFCVVSYLSQAPEGIRQAFIAGGLPPLGRHPDEVYRATYARILDRVQRFYQRYPADRARVRELHDWLDAEDVRLPSGDRLTSRRFRQLGFWLGMSDGMEKLHYLLELPADSPAFLHDAEAGTAFARNPLYAIIHEACYADGHATRWSAARVQPDKYADDVERFTGEHVFPWMFTDYGALAPLREAADLLAERPWPRLYDPDRLRDCSVPVAAVIYADDPYVEVKFSQETADAIRGLRAWVTPEYDHNALMVHGNAILDRLIDLATE